MSDQKLDLILDELTKLHNRLGGLEDKIGEIATKSDAIMEQVVKNSEDVTVIKDNQQIIGDIIKRQEDTINILARRSIDQEAEIKRIK